MALMFDWFIYGAVTPDGASDTRDWKAASDQWRTERADKRTTLLKALELTGQEVTVTSFMKLYEFSSTWADPNADQKALRGEALSVWQNMIVHPELNPEILRFLFEEHYTRFASYLMQSPALPRDIMKKMIEMSGTPADGTKSTNGGELIAFFVYNLAAPADLIDLAVKKTKQARVLTDFARHRNISRSTLEWMTKNCKQISVRKEAALRLAISAEQNQTSLANR